VRHGDGEPAELAVGLPVGLLDRTLLCAGLGRAVRGQAVDGERTGLVVSRKVGGAVARNRAKRLLREALRLEGKQLPEGLDLVVVARPSVADASYREIAGDIRDLLNAAGLHGGDAA
jgi:ribonuclease P protein component